jgi:hypothetical protein
MIIDIEGGIKFVLAVCAGIAVVILFVLWLAW